MDIVLTGLIFFIGGLVQSSLGFGLGMIALPLLLAHGFNLSESVLLLAISSGLQTIIGSYSLRKNIPWKEVIKAVLIRGIALYFGVEFLSYITSMPIDKVKQVFGLVLLLIVLVKIFHKNKVQKEIHQAWAYFAFLLSGFMAGSFGVGGPPLVIWANSMDWQQKTIRAFLLGTFALSVPVMLTLLMLKFPSNVKPLLEICLYTVPFMLVGIFLGLKIGNRVSTEKFKNITYIFLGLLSLTFIFRPFFSN